MFFISSTLRIILFNIYCMYINILILFIKKVIIIVSENAFFEKIKYVNYITMLSIHTIPIKNTGFINLDEMML